MSTIIDYMAPAREFSPLGTCTLRLTTTPNGVSAQSCSVDLNPKLDTQVNCGPCASEVVFPNHYTLNLGGFTPAAVTASTVTYNETVGSKTVYYEADVEPHLGLVNSGTNEYFIGEVKQASRGCIWGSSKGFNYPYRTHGFGAFPLDPSSNFPPGYARSGDTILYNGSGYYDSSLAAMHGTSANIPINNDAEHDGVTSIAGVHPSSASAGAQGADVSLTSDPPVAWGITSTGGYSQFLLTISGSTFSVTLKVFGSTRGRIYAIEDSSGNYVLSTGATYTDLKDIPGHPVNGGTITYTGTIDCDNPGYTEMTTTGGTGLFASAPSSAILTG